MRLRSTTVLPLLLLCLTRAGIAAQAVDFHVLHDSLSRVDDVAALRELEEAARARASASASAAVEHGLIALRLYDLTADRFANQRATRAFQSALERDPTLGWAHFGFGLSLASSPEAKPLSEGGRRGRLVLDDLARKLTGTDPRSKARKAFNAALHARPPINQAARALAHLALKSWNRESLEEATAALEQLAGQGAAQPEDLALLAQLQTALGQTSDAIDSADRARAAADNSATPLFAAALARLRTKGHEADGERLYFESVAAADDAFLESRFRDLEPIADEAEKKRFRAADASARRAFFSTFWELRAALGGVAVAERIAEHYTRVANAEQQYRRNAEFGVQTNPLRLLPAQRWSRFDDRGEIYIRHGEPRTVIRTVSSEAFNESWVYRQPDGSSRLYHFFKYPQSPDFVLPYILPCDAEFWSDRALHDARASAFSGRCTPRNQLAYSADWRQTAWQALESDSHYRSFTRELPFLYDLYTFRGAPGTTTVVAAFAVAAKELEATNREQHVKYRFDLSLILADTATGTVSRTDDSASIVTPRPLDGDELLRAHLEVQVPPSPTTLQRVIVTDPSQPGIGQLYGGPFPIPDYSGSHLMLSDIALGQLETGRGWRRGDVTLALVPTNQFKGGNFVLYYEIYNLPAGVHYTTEVVIDRLDRGAAGRLRDLFGGDRAIRFKFEGESIAKPDATMPEMRRIAAPLGKGRYRLTVTVKNLQSGQSAKASRQFVIPD